MMKQFSRKKTAFWIVIGLAIFFSVISATASTYRNTKHTLHKYTTLIQDSTSLVVKAYSILNQKCNSCHKRQNPFMVFSMRNMNKRSSKIWEQVFELKRMPKKNGEPLTAAEYDILNNWIKTVNN